MLVTIDDETMASLFPFRSIFLRTYFRCRVETIGIAAHLSEAIDFAAQRDVVPCEGVEKGLSQIGTILIVSQESSHDILKTKYLRSDYCITSRRREAYWGTSKVIS